MMQGAEHEITQVEDQQSPYLFQDIITTLERCQRLLERVPEMAPNLCVAEAIGLRDEIQRLFLRFPALLKAVETVSQALDIE